MHDAVGIVLAAGGGRRFGAPKALAGGAQPWVVGAVRALRSGGCHEVVVVTGAASEQVARALAGQDVAIVQCHTWATGMGASLRTALEAVDERHRADAALVHLVDLPDVGADVVERLLQHAAPDALARAEYAHGPGHPVLIGRDHWAAAAAAAVGDRGARDLLTGPETVLVDCRDLATGRDVDRPDELGRLADA